MKNVGLISYKNTFFKLEYRNQCLQEVLELVSEDIGDQMDELQEILSKYCEIDKPFARWIIPWMELKEALEHVERNDIAELLQKQTLLTKGTTLA